MRSLSTATLRHVVYACKVLVTDALGERRLMKVGKGKGRTERELAVFREVFGGVDVDVLHGFIENAWRREFERRGDSPEKPTSERLSNIFWTLFFRFVYRKARPRPFFFREGEVIDVPRALVVSERKVGSRRRVNDEFFSKNRLSKKHFKATIRNLLLDEKKGVVRSWLSENGWEMATEVGPDTPNSRLSSSRLSSRASRSSSSRASRSSSSRASRSSSSRASRSSSSRSSSSRLSSSRASSVPRESVDVSVDVLRDQSIEDFFLLPEYPPDEFQFLDPFSSPS